MPPVIAPLNWLLLRFIFTFEREYGARLCPDRLRAVRELPCRLDLLQEMQAAYKLLPWLVPPCALGLEWSTSHALLAP